MEKVPHGVETSQVDQKTRLKIAKGFYELSKDHAQKQ